MPAADGKDEQADQEPRNEPFLGQDSGSEAKQDEPLFGLLFESSPYSNPDRDAKGRLDAIVQHDGRAVYFFLHGDDAFGTRACWVRNLVEAPYVLNQEDLSVGRPPMMPRTHCKTAGPMQIPKPTSLSIVWFEEGNGAALFEGQQLIAVIPPWSGTDGFHGYAAECIAENALAWPLDGLEPLERRIHNAKKFWDACAQEEHHPFADLQPQFLDVYDRAFGPQRKYYSLDGGMFPPRGAVVYHDESQATIATVGMALRPQPNVEMAVESPAKHRRIELAATLPGSVSETELQPFLEQLSGLVAYPWHAHTWFAAGHTCHFPAFANTHGAEYDSAKFETDPDKERPNPVELPNFRGDPVRLLWLVPDKATES